MSQDKGRPANLGCWISDRVAALSAHPLAQIGFVILCVVWLVVGQAIDVLTAIISVLAITLTQMVLNRQQEREKEAHRRDVALHAKLDELLFASRRARDELAGIEELEEEKIEELKRTNVTALRPARSR
jgi:low affinity Fe/Cu permease